VPIVLKSGNLNHLEHWGPVHACITIALPSYMRNFYSTNFQLTKFWILSREFIYVFLVIPTQYVYYFRKRREILFSFFATETGCVFCATRNENYILLVFRLISGLKDRAWFRQSTAFYHGGLSFSPGKSLWGFMVDELALGQDFFSGVSFHFHSISASHSSF